MPGKTSFFNQSGLAGAGYASQSVDSYIGEALNIPRVNAGETSMEFRTPAQTLAAMVSAFAVTLLDDTSAAAMRTTLGLVIGTDVQAYDATILVDADIGVNVEAYDATILKDADIGSTVQAYDADLTTWAGITPSANAQSLVSAASYAAMRTLLDLEAGTDFYSITAANAAFEPIDATILKDANIGVTVQAYDATIVVDADIGVTVQGYDADTAKTDVVDVWTAAQRGEVTALTDGVSISLNLALSNNFSVTLAGNRTLANPTNIVAGQSGLITVTQDGTGTRTLAYGTYYKFAGGTAPVLSTAIGAVDTLSYYVKSSTEILVSAALDWS